MVALYLTWNFVKISIINDKDILEPDEYEYFLYEKEGILYRKYLRDMIDEKDY